MSYFAKLRSSKPPAMTLEGVLGPNGRLDDAQAISLACPDALAVASDGRLLMSSGSSIWSSGLWGEAATLWLGFDQAVTALATSLDGLVAVGLAGGEVRVHHISDQRLAWTVAAAPNEGPAMDCVFLSEDEVAIVRSGYASAREALAVAPWDASREGAVKGHASDGTMRTIASALRCPMGICRNEHGDLVITELDAARAVDASGRVLRAGFPGYLGRIRKTPRGYLLSCLSRRDPLIEFLRTERGFVEEMKRTVDPRHWISPRTSPEFSHDFPIELGATRLFGEIKPWAPSFSYGLLIMLDKDLMPIGSAQSRADCRRHAISDAVVWNGDMITVSQASGEILNLGPLA